VSLTSSGALTPEDILANGVRDQPEVDGIATLDGDTVQILVWNYHDDIVAVAAAPVHLAVKVPASFGASARVSHLRVDESHGDAYTVWVSQGMPASPSAAQVAALRQAMDPALLVPDRTVAVAADRSVGLDFDLPRFGVSLVTILPAAGTGDGGTDIDGDGSSSPPGSGCGCRAGDRGDAAPDWAAVLGIGVLILILVTTVRRRSVRAGRQFS
jgi:xylan 1,4-beta-xylosidase